jgi:hypothetical protein
MEQEGLGQKIKAFTNIYFTEYNSEEYKVGRMNQSESEKFACDLLDKIIENFSTVGELLILSETDRMNFLRNSIYILLRSSLSDCIILIWLFESQKNELPEECLKIKAESMLRDHIKYYVSQMKKLEILGLLTADEKKYEIDIINKEFIHLLTEPIKDDLNSKNIRPSIPIRDMIGEHNKDNPAIVAAYKAYCIFSKIEHPGVFTRMILESSYKNEENPMDQHLDSSIHVIESVIKVYLRAFFKNPSFLKEMNEHKL